MARWKCKVKIKCTPSVGTYKYTGFGDTKAEAYHEAVYREEYNSTTGQWEEVHVDPCGSFPTSSEEVEYEEIGGDGGDGTPVPVKSQALFVIQNGTVSRYDLSTKTTTVLPNPFGAATALESYDSLVYVIQHGKVWIHNCVDNTTEEVANPYGAATALSLHVGRYKDILFVLQNGSISRYDHSTGITNDLPNPFGAATALDASHGYGYVYVIQHGKVWIHNSVDNTTEEVNNPFGAATALCLGYSVAI